MQNPIITNILVSELVAGIRARHMSNNVKSRGILLEFVFTYTICGNINILAAEVYLKRM